MNRIVAMVSFFLVATSFVDAQKTANHGLVINASVQGVDSTCIDGRLTPRVRLYVQFRNDGNKPLIVLTPGWIFTTKVQFALNEQNTLNEKTVPANSFRYNPYREDPYNPGSTFLYDPVPSYIKGIDTDEPPRTIAPGGYYEFQDAMWIRSGFRTDMKPGTTQKQCEEKKAKSVPEYPSFFLEYHLSLKDHDRGRDLLKTLKERWKPYGHLLLDSRGDVTYRTERIVFDTSN